jgi:integrase
LHRLPLTHITQAQFDAWRSDHLLDHSEASTNLVARYLKLWLRWALGDKLIKEMPCKINQPRPQEVEKPIVELDEVEVVMDAIRKGHRNPQVPAAVAFAMMLGLRESEVLGARWEAIQGTTYTVSGKSSARGRTKSKRIRKLT